MKPSILTEEIIARNLDTLSHGGKEAVSLFMEMCERLHDRGATDAMKDWVTIAAPALPEKERIEVLVTLMCSHLFVARQMQAQINSESPASRLH